MPRATKERGLLDRIRQLARSAYHPDVLVPAPSSNVANQIAAEMASIATLDAGESFIVLANIGWIETVDAIRDAVGRASWSGLIGESLEDDSLVGPDGVLMGARVVGRGLGYSFDCLSIC